MGVWLTTGHNIGKMELRQQAWKSIQGGVCVQLCQHTPGRVRG